MQNRPVRFSKDIVIENQHHRFQNKQGHFVVDVYMNASDAMSAAVITSLPEDQNEAIAALRSFTDLFYKDYGAKAFLRIDPKLLAKVKLPEDFLKPGGDGEYCDQKQLKQVIGDILAKPAVQVQLNKFFDEDGYQLLRNKDLQGRERELSELKILHSSFASDEKIDAGLYSEAAEKRKLRDAQLFALQYRGQLIATVMYFQASDILYLSDFVIHPDYRGQKLAQTFSAMTFKEQLEHCTGAWFIAGGHGKEAEGQHLYGEILRSRSLKTNPQLQQEVGLVLKFGPPGPEIKLAGNRSLEDRKGKSLDDPRILAEAKAALAKSNEKNLAAPQPVAPPKPGMQVVGISMYQPAGSSQKAEAGQVKSFRR